MPASASALTETAAMPDLPTLILEVPEPIWRKISSALQVKTRQEAVQLVQADEQAAAIVTGIIRSSRSALTEGKAPPKSALTSAPAPEPVADRLYGGGGKARLKIG